MLLEEPTTLMDVALMGRAAVVALSLAGARLEALDPLTKPRLWLEAHLYARLNAR